MFPKNAFILLYWCFSYDEETWRSSLIKIFIVLYLVKHLNNNNETFLCYTFQLIVYRCYLVILARIIKFSFVNHNYLLTHTDTQTDRQTGKIIIIATGLLYLHNKRYKINFIAVNISLVILNVSKNQQV